MHIEFPQSLPVSAHREDIAAAIREHQVVIVCGETGSGKTTQLPKIALAMGRGGRGKTIAHTQPRRLAAVTVAKRIAQELKTECGDGPTAQVGYQIRFQDRSRPGIPVKLMTDGILLAQTQADPMLSAYDTVIVDEAHERSLNIDFLLGYLKNLLPRRPDLRVIITSATIDAERFAAHFGSPGRPAPVIEVSGRMFPVEIRWRPAQSTDQDLVETVMSGIEECERDWNGQGPGDILVFLPGEREIKAVADELRGRPTESLLARSGKQATEVLPLYARLSQADQERVFRSSGRRRVVLATNVAETSLTVPGIRYVVDSGLARVKRYRYRAKVEQLQIEPIPQAQANQRMGRCGRLAEGVCIRLFEESDFNQRPQFADPEIHRSALAAVMLRMKALGLPDVREFPFIDPPSGKAIADGLVVLRELNALDAQGQLTEIGWTLSKLPVDPRIGRMLIEARRMGALKEVLVIASALSVQDPRERPQDQAQVADRLHARFHDPKSEFMVLLRLWHHLQALLDAKESNRKHDQALRGEFLSPLRAREWREVHQQLGELIRELHWRPNEQPASDAAIHLAVLSGLLSNVGCRAADEPIWLGCHDVKFLVWPGSSLAKKPPRWLMAAEQVETSRLFARTIAAIEPEWVEQMAGHVLKKSHAEPHWEKRSERVVGYERATLYGLTIYQRRKVAWAQLGAVQRDEAREIFIRQALVEGDWECTHRFFAVNQKRIREIEALEHKARRPDILVDDELLFAFYDQQIPADVVDAQSFGAWYGHAVRQDPEILCLKKEDLMRHEAAGITTEQFPKLHRHGRGGTVRSFALEYHFEPGDPRDGVTLIATPETLLEVEPVAMEWLVPGMLREKIQALLKSLPQKIRRHCVPLPDYAQSFCDRWADKAGTIGLIPALIQDISQQTGIAARRDDFKLDGISVHCRMNIRVVDPHGRRLAEGRDLESLMAELGVSPEQAEKAQGRASREQWIERFAQGCKDALKSLEKEVHGRRDVGLAFAPFGSHEQLMVQLRTALIGRIFLSEGLPQSEAEFDERLIKGRSRVLLIGQEMLRWLGAVLIEYAQLQKKLPGLKLFRAAATDVEQQLARLLPKDFITLVPPERAAHLPRYLKAIASRVDKCRADPARDQKWMQELAQVEAPFWRWAAQQRGAWPERMIEFRWMLEELRVSLFAQELKTPMPVSVKRLQKSWAGLLE
ncbi:MAG: ATP-dependent RNA helicase HrpA [Burkholderiaceae bacterium]|nr:ATP-dependent RNA helicase HrpA [Burkholderiaceae bacterium]